MWMLTDFTCIPVIFKCPAIEKAMHIIDALRLSVAFTQETRGVCTFLALIFQDHSSCRKTAKLIQWGFQKQSRRAKARQIIPQEAVNIVIQAFIWLFFISCATWDFIFMFRFPEEISLTSGQGIHRGDIAVYHGYLSCQGLEIEIGELTSWGKQNSIILLKWFRFMHT